MQGANWYQETLELAKALHLGQNDKAGAPYWLHLERVAQRLVDRFPDATKAQIQAALLHDAIEDAGSRYTRLRMPGFHLLNSRRVGWWRRPSPPSNS